MKQKSFKLMSNISGIRAKKRWVGNQRTESTSIILLQDLEFNFITCLHAFICF